MSEVSALTPNSQIQEKNSHLRLLVLSNGHGEDAIAVRIVQELQQQLHPPEIFALPLVGEGYAYQNLSIPLIGSVRAMPSGGFIYMDGWQFLRDLGGGLIQLTFNQILTIRSWVNSQQKSGKNHAILAVGDLLPLLFAWMSGTKYAFVGTAKSEYHVRDEKGLLKRDNLLAHLGHFSGSVYHPWERWLMSHHRCKAVFPRDSLTTKILKKWSIPVFDVGNPMMDDLEPTFPTARFYSSNSEKRELGRPLIVTLLPGSRPPEAYANWQKILLAVSALISMQQTHNWDKFVFLGAIAPSLHFASMRQILQSHGWYPHPDCPVTIPDDNALTFYQKNAYFILTQKAYNDCLHMADIAIAMAGTATEQFVGLGKPAITMPGKGPQFNSKFAQTQSRLLGPSVILVEEPHEVTQAVRSLFANPDQLHVIAENGLRRMGKAGAARRIAECLIERVGC
ncbi:lipid-A-disaccharide synthase-related protein [Fischerella sp. JS2]|uniref:lipid-A-disaccharide synthase-related protein n=1 Tax=Fischerella sp. JS2 TaxID=2597771 RepID=UPI0028EF05E4|nr:lipid-A-disaccharide synthase-related protein [Fischerella sp. JS2]